MATERFANNAQGTLAIVMTPTSNFVQTTNSNEFPLLPQFRIRIDSELLLVTSVAGSVFGVQRGIENTAPASHLPGATVTHVLTALGLTTAIGSGGGGGPGYLPPTEPPNGTNSSLYVDNLGNSYWIPIGGYSISFGISGAGIEPSF